VALPAKPLLLAELGVLLVGPLGGLLEGRDDLEVLRLRRLSLVCEDRGGIAQDIEANEQVSPVLAHGGAVWASVNRSPPGQELGHAQLVGGRGGLLRYRVVSAEDELPQITVSVVVDGFAHEKSPRGLEGAQAAVKVLAAPAQLQVLGAQRGLRLVYVALRNT
jgi:hypothetical protein